MHIECACLESCHIGNLPRLDLRRRLGNEKLECVRCQDCPCCIVKKNNVPRKSRATLIVCPPAILDQWAEEIRRHTSQMKVLIYHGVDKESKRSAHGSLKLLHPTYLANADLILISFVALMSDLAHSDENRFISRHNEYSKLRKRKKYRESMKVALFAGLACLAFH